MKHSSRSVIVTVLLGISFAVSTAHSQVSAGRTFFDKGRTRLSLTGGWGQVFDESYFVLGAGAGYFLLPGLELGVDGETWLGNSPQISKVTPGIRYVFHTQSTWYPYLGAFYRRTFYEDLDDLDSVGARAGVFMPMSDRVYFGVGGVFERQLDCDTRIYDNCTVLYPEFAITVGF